MIEIPPTTVCSGKLEWHRAVDTGHAAPPALMSITFATGSGQPLPV